MEWQKQKCPYSRVSQRRGGVLSFRSLRQSRSLEFVLLHLVLAPGVETNFKTRGKHKELAHSGVLALISPEPLTHSVIFSKTVDLPVLCATQLIVQARSSLKWKVWGCVFLHVLDPPLTVKMFKVKT